MSSTSCTVSRKLARVILIRLTGCSEDSVFFRDTVKADILNSCSSAVRSVSGEKRYNDGSLRKHARSPLSASLSCKGAKDVRASRERDEQMSLP